MPAPRTVPTVSRRTAPVMGVALTAGPTRPRLRAKKPSRANSRRSEPPSVVAHQSARAIRPGRHFVSGMFRPRPALPGPVLPNLLPKVGSGRHVTDWTRQMLVLADLWHGSALTLP